MNGDWSVLEVDAYVDCRSLYALVETRKLQPQTVLIHDIDYKPLSDIQQTQGRYIRADIDLPVLVCPDMPTPNDRPYRMLDGRHRLLKAKTLGNTTVQAYVVLQEDVMKFIKT